MRIWAKVIKDEKLIKDMIFTFDYRLTRSNFEACLMEISSVLDILTPISIDYHYKCFHNFNTVKYLESDFIEDVPFNCLVLDNIID